MQNTPPKIEPAISRGRGGPPTFDCRQLKTSFYRIRGSWAPARKGPGGLALLGEEADWRSYRRKIFVIWFQEYNDTGELLLRLQEFVRDYQIEDVYARLSKPEHDFLSFFNSEKQFGQRVSVQRPPKAEESGVIDYFLNLVNELLRPGMQRVFFPSDSNIVQMLQSLSDHEFAHDITDIDHPSIASIVYGIAALNHYPTTEPEQAQRFEKKKPYDPWAILDY